MNWCHHKASTRWEDEAKGAAGGRGPPRHYTATWRDPVPRAINSACRSQPW